MTPRLRILHVGKYYPPVAGGMERFLADLVKAQRAAGHEVAVLVHAHERAAPANDPAWLLRCPVWVKLLFAPLSPRFPWWLARAIRAHRPQVLHLHLPNVSACWALLVPAARRLPWVIHWHSDIELSKTRLKLAYPHYRLLERALLERAECIVPTSPQYLAASAALRPWQYKCHVVPLGVDPGRLPDVKGDDSLWQAQGTRLLAVGRLTYYKGFETLLRAVLGEPRLQLTIVGEGEERPRLQRLLADAGNPASVRLLGEADDATLHRLMASCDVFCLPSIERTEAFGIVLMEAMRYGRALAVSDLRGSGVLWLAREGQNAVRIPPGDVREWREALVALALAPARRQVMGHLGYQRYLRELGIAQVASKLDGAYAVALRNSTEESAVAIEAPPMRYADRDEDHVRGRADRLLIVIPALNEAACIGGVIEEARAHGNTDVLVIDDGSTDDTRAVAVLSGATVLSAPLWQGAWGAIQTGIRYAVRHGYGGVVTMDADGQHEPAYLPQLLGAARDADVVIAACPSRGSRMRHLAWAYFRFLTGFNYEDLTSGFRFYNARACRLLSQNEATLLDYQDIGVLLLLRRAKMRIAEIPVAMNRRRDGASRVFYSWWTIAGYMAETTLLCLARWNLPRSRP